MLSFKLVTTIINDYRYLNLTTIQKTEVIQQITTCYCTKTKLQFTKYI